MVYEPREDSFLLQKHVREYAKGTVLDMGTGSGIIAKEAAATAESVFAADIDPEAVRYCNDHHVGIEFVESDLFSYFKGKSNQFDLITFNPPYLPDDERVKDIALDGGRHGYELLKRFIEELPEYLKQDGKCLILFSSLTNKEKVDEIILHNCLSARQLDSQKLDFEELYVYLIEKSGVRKDLENNRIRNIRYFTKGKRGLIYTGELEHLDVAIKTQNPDSKAMGRIEHEAEMLSKLNKHGIGPRLLFSGWGYMVYEFVPGVLFRWFLENSPKEDILTILEDVLAQLSKLDSLNINKEEMHNPYKHIIIGKRVVLLDFERAHPALKPQNLTQFCDYLISDAVYPTMKEKGFLYDKDTLIKKAREYRLSTEPMPEKITDYLLEK